MRKVIFLTFAALILVSASAKLSFATPYWQQSFSQSSSETWADSLTPLAPIGQFNAIGVQWVSGSHFTTSPIGLSGFPSSWTFDTDGNTRIFAKTATLTDNANFFVNLEYLGKPLETSFYYGVFKVNGPINNNDFSNVKLLQGQLFTFNGQNWQANSVTQTELYRASGLTTTNPEPISSTLFLLGGAAFGLKKLRRKQ